MAIDKIGIKGFPELPKPEGIRPQKIDKPDLSSQEFREFLEPKVNPELKFSNHAKTRLESRGIELSSDEILKMQEAVRKAGEKGSKESLILTDKAAFVVSVKNNTVITAMDKASLKENVFTNIDSTIMI